MADEYLHSQLLGSSPAKLEKKESNTDILNCLFQFEVPPAKKKEQPPQKKKHEEQINNYISSVKKSKPVPTQRSREEAHYSKPQSAKPTPSTTAKPPAQSNPKPAEAKSDKKQAKYMPTVVDIFAKKDDKSKSQKEVPTQKQKIKPPVQPDPLTKVSKAEAKKEKIERKRENETAKEIKVVPRPATPVPAKKEAQKPKNIEQRPMKKKKQESSSSSSSESEQESSSESGGMDWKKHLRDITGYNPAAKKFRERDHMEIKQSGVEAIFRQDKFSYRMGLKEEEQDLRLQKLQEMRKLQKLKKKEHRH